MNQCEQHSIISSALSRLEAMVLSNNIKTDKLYQVLIEGNGEPSIKEATRQNDRRISVLEKTQSESRSDRRDLFWKIAGPVLPLIYAALFVYFKGIL